MLDKEQRPEALPWIVRKAVAALRALKRSRFRAAARPK
jgi:hypothetical protein